ncbi:hypothetical protein [Streptomyces sp. RKAG293]|uniref:hypothetical protein n=1 Tax=Streptomyces sp. RKAG293 TaxID=2893403 RepID=UPI002033C519|nr:hypothetical protein [Streptomyces sp. RKAG293]MCM2416616.1 hypothetical protein [Streptomyces sp. RKAG293]
MLTRLRPLPDRNELYGCVVAVACMAAASEAQEPPYGALVDLARAIREHKVDVYGAAARIRSWRVSRTAGPTVTATWWDLVVKSSGPRSAGGGWP